MKAFFPFRSSWLLFVLLLIASVPKAFPQCQTLPEPQFFNFSQESGNMGEVNSVYRFTSVLPGVDALITIESKWNTSLIAMDLTETGSDGNWQPHVNLDWQSNAGNVGFMDFAIRFVNAGTTDAVPVSEIALTAVDVDGDNYRLREGVGFTHVNTFELENPTRLISYEDEAFTIFDASTVDNKTGIHTSATEHMVTAKAFGATEIGVRCQITANPGSSGWSNAQDRMFSFTFDPCIPETYIIPNSFPVEMGEFAGEAKDGRVNLTWMTFSELNNDHFEIQRSDDGRLFYPVGEVQGHGTTEEGKKYAFWDQRPNAGVNYYRLRQVDFDGQFQYSSVVEVKLADMGYNLSLWPNPAHSELFVRMPAEVTVDELSLISPTGQSYLIQHEAFYGDELRIDLMMSDLPSGIYFLRMKLDGQWQKGMSVQIQSF